MKTTGLTLKEAVESKKPFRRPSWAHADWMIADSEKGLYGGGSLRWKLTGDLVALHYLDELLATDFHLEPIKKEISREDLAAAWNKYVHRNSGLDPAEISSSFNLFCSHLGFESPAPPRNYKTEASYVGSPKEGE